MSSGDDGAVVLLHAQYGVLVYLGSNGKSGGLTQSKGSGVSGLSFSLLKKQAVPLLLLQAGEIKSPYTNSWSNYESKHVQWTQNRLTGPANKEFCLGLINKAKEGMPDQSGVPPLQWLNEAEKSSIKRGFILQVTLAKSWGLPTGSVGLIQWQARTLIQTTSPSQV